MRKMVAALGTAALTGALVIGAASSAEAAGGVILYRAQYNSPGTDNGSNASLNGEWVELKNTSSSTKTVTGWTVRDKQNHVYTFPTTTIGAGKYLVVRTGSGANNAGNRYWGQHAYIWNNTGDAAYLRTQTGALVDSCSWGGTGTYRNC